MKRWCNNHLFFFCAKKSGIIKKIEVEKGVILKKKNDYVEEGYKASDNCDGDLTSNIENILKEIFDI